MSQNRAAEAARWGRGEMAAGGGGEQGSAVLELPRGPRLVCVEYPGLVRDVGKMLQTLGGDEGVSRVRGTPGGGRARGNQASWLKDARAAGAFLAGCRPVGAGSWVRGFPGCGSSGVKWGWI